MGAVVPILSLVSICAVTAVYAADYLGTAGSVAVALTSRVMSLYSGMLVDFLRELTGAKEPERADWLLIGNNPGGEAIVVRPMP
jgi:hypothetical protein